MANFPATPAVGDKYTTGTLTYTWDGTAWKLFSSIELDELQDTTILNKMDGDMLEYNLATNQWLNVPQRLPWRNKIINGDMRIDQRRSGGGSAVPANTVIYAVDRFVAYSTLANFTTGRDFLGPSVLSGFTNYSGVSSTATGVLAASTNSVIETYIEGFNCQDMLWGTSAARTMVLSFWFFSYNLGNYAIALRNAGATRSYVTQFSGGIGGWQKIEVVIPGDTAGSWNVSNGVGVFIDWNLGTGTTFRTSNLNAWQNGNFLSGTSSFQTATVSGAWYLISGVQFEIGNRSTQFEYVPHNEMLARCQRYYWNIRSANFNKDASIAVGYTIQDGARAVFHMNHPVEMRINPTVNYSGRIMVTDNWNYAYQATGLTFNSNRLTSNITLTALGTGNRPCNIYTENPSGFIEWTAE